MIQRIQSIYLVAMVLICLMLSTGSLLSGMTSIPGQVTQYDLGFIYMKITENGTLIDTRIQFILIALLALVIGWTLNILFAFRNRVKQIKMVKWNFLFIGLLIVSLFATAIIQIPGFSFSAQNMQSVFGLALLIFLFYLNMRCLMLIKKDEELVKSADRIR